MDQVEEQLTKSVLSRTLLDSIIREVVLKRNIGYAKLEHATRIVKPSRPQTPESPVEEKVPTPEAEVHALFNYY